MTRSNSRSGQALSSSRRQGKILVMVAVMLPMLLGVAGLVIDGGLIFSEHRVLQTATDAAATAVAFDLRSGDSADSFASTADYFVRTGHRINDASVVVNVPPLSGEFAGESGYVEVIASRSYRSRILRLIDGVLDWSLSARAVAGVNDVTSEAAIVVLDPDPLDLAYPTPASIAATVDNSDLISDAILQCGVTDFLEAIPILGTLVANLAETELESLIPGLVDQLVGDVATVLPGHPLPSLTAGFEIEGLGTVRVDGAVHVNNEWGGVDEDGNPAGAHHAPPYAVACTPLIQLTKLATRDLRVAGGVDSVQHYSAFDPSENEPLTANRLPVPDPLLDLPVPSILSDGTNVVATEHSPADAVRIALPTSDATSCLANVSALVPALIRPAFDAVASDLSQLISQPVLSPGVYNSITVLSPAGGAVFEPGIYVIRGVNPDTQLSLCILGPVEAEGVLFYITDDASFDVSTGLPDADDNPNDTPPNTLTSQLPSTLIATLLPGASLSGLEAPGSPFDNLLLYQRRSDRRPIILEGQNLLGASSLSGTIYSKWGHLLVLTGATTYDMSVAVGTLRWITISETVVASSNPFPAAQDVLLLE